MRDTIRIERAEKIWRLIYLPERVVVHLKQSYAGLELKGAAAWCGCDPTSGEQKDDTQL